jgi:ParB family chromosome partitioning protein
VPAIIREADDDQAELLEIEENLIRHDLNALDRAVFVARWKEVYQRLHPTEGKRGRKLRQVGAIAFARSAEAKKIGLSKRSIEREARRVSLIAPDVRPQLAGTDAATKGVVLDALGRLDHDAQRQVMALYRTGEANSIAAALRSLRGPAPAADEDALFARLLAAWAKAPVAVQRRLLAHIGAVITIPAKKRRGA